MWGLGLWEIVAILVVAVVFLRPRDVPAFFRSMGRAYSQLVDLYRAAVRTMEEAQLDIDAVEEKRTRPDPLPSGSKGSVRTEGERGPGVYGEAHSSQEDSGREKSTGEKEG